jgi:hypothetical protein
MVPPWVPDVDSPSTGEQPSPPEQPDQEKPAAPAQPPKPAPIAPPGRFRSTRTSLGKFAGSGDSDQLRRGVGHYVRTGLGGTGVATRRFGGTARTAGALYAALGGQGASAARPTGLDPAALVGKSARAVINAIIEAVSPVDGTQDREASRNAINDALSELMQRHPDADLLSPSEQQREFVVERFVGMDVYRRFVLDVGTAIQGKAASASVALSRLKEARDYIRETVSASFRKLRELGERLSGNRVSQLVQRALKDALDVFSGYAE